jgi:hypothetical protein
MQRKSAFSLPVPAPVREQISADSLAQTPIVRNSPRLPAHKTAHGEHISASGRQMLRRLSTREIA